MEDSKKQGSVDDLSCGDEDFSVILSSAGGSGSISGDSWEKQGFSDLYGVDEAIGVVSDELSVTCSSSSYVEGSAVGSDLISCDSRENGGAGDEVGLTERLTDILVDDSDADLLLQQSDREDRVIQWLQALDKQVVGACRADERLRTLLKLNASSGAAEYSLMAHLSQHFEPSEVGMLARCLCIPLVSIRVGKINKHGTLLCPTSSRGILNLTLLPTSDMRISFVGDDGCTERLSTLTTSQCTAVAIEEIEADNSGRSFLVKVPDGPTFYFWCSEKSKFLGVELLAKMKDLLRKKPSLAELTGITESRLECFAIHLRAYLVGSTVNTAQSSPTIALSTSLDGTPNPSEVGQTDESSSSSSKPLRSRLGVSHAIKPNPVYQCSLSPRSSSFKEGWLPRNSSALRNVGRDKLRRRGDIHPCVASLPASFPFGSDESVSGSASTQGNKLPEASGTSSLPSPPSFLELIRKSEITAPQFPSVVSTLLSPYYCWCPPTTLQYKVQSQLPISSIDSISLPPLSSLLPPVTRSTALLSMPPPLSVPSMFPDPLVRLPFSMPISQQIATFTPLMCDPIVHIPIIDVCSSGPAYAISTSIPPMMTETESMLEQSARETLRMLINSSQSNPQVISGSSIAAMGLVQEEESGGSSSPMDDPKDSAFSTLADKWGE